MNQPETVFASEPVLALRTWLLSPTGQLKGWTYFDDVWPVREAAKAICSTSNKHTHFSCPQYTPSVPHVHGRCGLHGLAATSITQVTSSWSSYWEALRYRFWFDHETDALIHLTSRASVVAGIVALWGRVIKGSTGLYRAEFGYPVVLFQTDAVVADYGCTLVPVPTSLPTLQETVEYARFLLKEVTPHEPR